MTDPPKRSTLNDLDARLKAARQRQEEASGGAGRKARAAAPSGMGFGFRLAIELITGLVFGAVIGWFLDQWLGTLPLFLVLFFLLGAGAGILNVYRVASGQGYAVGYRKKDEDKAGEKQAGGKKTAARGDETGEGTGTKA